MATYILTEIRETTKQDEFKFGLYRDDGLAIANGSPREIENIKKKICQIFKQNGLKITIDANKAIVNYLDVTFNIKDGTYRPYLKPGNIPKYVNRKSNHPPKIIQAIPSNINKRLTTISSNETIFNEATKPYQKALEESGYKHKLTYKKDETSNNEKPRKRRRNRNIIWYNPPFEGNVKTNIGKEFFKLMNDCFPKTNRLSKIFNKNSIKLSYSCMNNMEQIITAQNNRKLKKHEESNDRNDISNKTCNCRDTSKCPLNNNCLQKGIVYEAKVETESTIETYIGLTDTTFKKRYSAHVHTFKNKDKSTSTELSKYIWTLKDNNKTYKITWKKIDEGQAYKGGGAYCQLCTREKFYITRKGLGSLNRRSELVTYCPHRKQFLLSNIKGH